MIIKTVCTHSIVKKKEQYSETQEDTGDLGHDIQNEGCYKKYYNRFNACHSFLVNSCRSIRCWSLDFSSYNFTATKRAGIISTSKMFHDA